MVGGSTVHIGTRFDVTLPGALKRILRSRFPHLDIEVINAGIISAISRQELIFLLTTLVDYELDMLIVYDGINDTGQMLYYEKRPNFPYNYKVMEDAWKKFVSERRDSLWRLILTRSTIVRRLWPDEYTDDVILEKIPAEQLQNNHTLMRSFADTHKDNWDKIRRVCTVYNIQPVFVLQPTSLYANFPDGRKSEELPDKWLDNLYANYLVYEEFRKTTQEFSEANTDIEVLDLASFLPADAFWDGAHVYDDINDIIAQKLADSIMDEIIGFSQN